MRLTQFYKLRHAASNLDPHFMAKKIAELEKSLTQDGRTWEMANTAVTEEGIFYINPESGMATRVALYQADQFMELPDLSRKKRQTAIVEMENFSNFHPYHLLRCNTLTAAERSGSTEGYRAAQRLDGRFFYRLLFPTGRDGERLEAMRMIPDPQLQVCPNCFFKVTSLLEGVRNLKLESFSIEYFFNVDFFRSWVRYGESSQSKNSMANMYPKDWDEICRIRREQVHYHCESCGRDYGSSSAKKLLHVHPTDHHKKKLSFVRLQCLCPECMSEQTYKSGAIKR
ncbi:MAG: hypothetical protein J0M12_07370 [Deltaproteobacteria bacterium]|nr:hypothetical protein [Deltaproteobacteria bacterium]